MIVTLLQEHVDEIHRHVRMASPAECCGLVGGRGHAAQSIYRLQNIATNPLVAYEAAPEGLFAAQRAMRKRGEQLLGIYHSHPMASEPVPSETDVRLAYYPSAIYFIVGLSESGAVLRAFRLFESEGRWEAAVYRVAES